jgi:glycosyltransferase involved in cell wall biosynthesis
MVDLVMISFVIPAYNEELELPSTLAAVHSAARDAKQDYEIVVVDDASTDATAEIAREAGARVVFINRRHIAAARNAGARAARGGILFFVDADTRINSKHVVDAMAALESGYSGGSARMQADGFIPWWGRIFMKIFCALYFATRLGAGAFLFTTRKNYEAAGGFDEQYFAGEEVFFSMALKKFGRFKILREPMITSGRKLRLHSGSYLWWRLMQIMLGGLPSSRSRKVLDLWYDGKRETSPPVGRTRPVARST